MEYRVEIIHRVIRCVIHPIVRCLIETCLPKINAKSTKFLSIYQAHICAAFKIGKKFYIHIDCKVIFLVPFMCGRKMAHQFAPVSTHPV
jgi:hypothetical protein